MEKFFYHYKYIQIQSCENNIREYRIVDEIKFFKKQDLRLKPIKYVVKNKFCKTITLNCLKSLIRNCVKLFILINTRSIDHLFIKC